MSGRSSGVVPRRMMASESSQLQEKTGALTDVAKPQYVHRGVGLYRMAA